MLSPASRAVRKSAVRHEMFIDQSALLISAFRLERNAEHFAQVGVIEIICHRYL